MIVQKPPARSPAVPAGGLATPLRHPRIEAIWISAAAGLGQTIQRASTAYASSSGVGVITIGVDEILDDDDALAQLIFHELCHAVIEGPERWAAPDWGLSNADDRDIAREHACLHLQVHLSEPHQLRELMAPTTEYRAYHDSIAADLLSSARASSDDAAASQSAVLLARVAIARFESGPWIRVIDQALRDTRAVLDSVATAQRGAVIAGVHPVGFAFTPGEETCGDCAWHYEGGRGRAVQRCRQSAGHDGIGRRTEARFRGCVRWEPRVDCQTCGACCREAYHSVTVSMRDPVVWKQPALVARTGHRFEILREGDRCAALAESVRDEDEGGGTEGSGRAQAKRRSFACRIYEDRPKPCREFAAGGPHCLVARRRVGLSP